MNIPVQVMRSSVLAFMLLLVGPVDAQIAAEIAPATDRSLATTNGPVEAPPDMAVPVMINDQGPFDFVIDTASSTMVISRELVDRLQLPVGSKAVVHAMGGSAEVRTVKIDKLAYATTSLQDIKAVAVARRNLGADGLLGIKQLKNQRVVMDFVTGTMRIEPSSSRSEPKSIKGDNVIVVVGKSRLGQLVLADADANGQKIWVIVDTGSGDSVGNSRLMDLLLRRNRRTAIRPVALIDVLGRSTPAQYTFVDVLRIGGVGISNVAIAFADAYPFKIFELTRKPSLLLGMATLRVFRRVTIDFAARRAYFEMPVGSAAGIPAGANLPEQRTGDKSVRLP